MKLLLFSDLHRDKAAARRLVQLAESVDVVIGAGDFATGRHGIHDTIDVLVRITRPVVLVAGNSESPEELRDVCQTWASAVVLHGASTVIGGFTFRGLGGAVPVTPFGAWSYDLTEDQAAELLADCPERCVLVSHSPPKGVLDQSSSGQSLGSTAVRDAMLRCRPQLIVCGHIHASAGRTEVVGETTVINAGPAGVIWSLSPSATDPT